MTTEHLESAARQLIAKAGGRLTKPRILTLVALIDAGRAVSHAEMQRRLPRVDRVSLYRALDWLADQQLAHRITDGNGVRRYGPKMPGDEHHHPHFHCTHCGTTTCLDQAQALAVPLPKGFRQMATDVLVKGLCKTCVSRR